MACRSAPSSSGAGASTRGLCGQRAGWPGNWLSGKRVAQAAQAAELGRLDQLPEETDVALDLRLVRAWAAEMGLGEAVGPSELLLDAGAPHVVLAAGRPDH